MKTFVNLFFRYLEKFSEVLESSAKRRQRKFAYFFCSLQIITCLMSAAAMIGFLIYNFPKQTSFEIRMVLIICCLVILFMLGSFIHMIITRDLRHAARTRTKRKTLPRRTKSNFDNIIV